MYIYLLVSMHCYYTHKSRDSVFFFHYFSFPYKTGSSSSKDNFLLGSNRCELKYFDIHPNWTNSTVAPFLFCWKVKYFEIFSRLAKFKIFVDLQPKLIQLVVFPFNFLAKSVKYVIMRIGIWALQTLKGVI